MQLKIILPPAYGRCSTGPGNFPDTINLCLGEPGAATADDIIQAAVSGLLEGRTKYTPNLGIPVLREAISAKMARDNHLSYDPEAEIIITTGATEALMLTMLTVLNPGDEVIIPDPAWPNYIGQVMMCHAIPILARLAEENGFRMTAELIGPLITKKTRLVVLNSPANPTGAMLDRQDLLEIARLVQKCGIFAISDEPYEKLVFDHNEHVSLASFPGMKEHVITINSFSKTYAMTGWRVGYACADAMLITQMAKLHENITSCLSEPAQLGCAYAIHHGDGFLRSMMEVYDTNRKILTEALNHMDGIHCRMPPATFYAFPSIKALGLDSQEAANLILDKCHVVTSPGSAFGKSGEGYIRICFASATDGIKEAVHRMGQLFGHA